MVAAHRGQVLRIAAIGLLVLIWTVRSRWTHLTGDISWGSKDPAQASRPSSPVPVIQGLGHSGFSGLNPNTLDLSDPDAPFIGWPLKRTCDEIDEWTPGVVFLCDNNFGGVGNVRNFVLTCVRYAIEAGATGIVMPAIRKRMDDDITKIYEDSFRPFSYLFDEENFREAMAENCPRIKIFDKWADIPGVRYLDSMKKLPEVQILDPRELDRPDTARCDFAELDHQTDRFRDRFKEMLSNPSMGGKPNATYPRLFRGTDRPGVLWEWPVWRDGPEMANTFAGLCKFNKDIMKLGKKALARMEAFARHQANAGKPPSTASQFLGVHLRTEADALDFWPTYEDQEEGYLGRAAELGLPVGYIASGDPTEARKFALAALEQLNMTMVSKEDILDADELAQLHALSWDQRGLVDYVVLTGAEHFTGNTRSSFSISVSKKRHLKSPDGLYTRPYKVRKKGYGRNFLVGPMELYYEHWLFIWDAMWP